MLPPQPLLPKYLVGINTKSYFDLPTTIAYTRALIKHASSLTSSPVGIFILPSHPCLYPTLQLLHPYFDPTSLDTPLSTEPRILLGAQDCGTENSGPYTGETSPLLLRQLTCSFVLLGHAERRAPPHNETNELVAAKAAAVVKNGMIPLICIGEKKKSESGIVSEAVGIAIRECTPQITTVLKAIPATGKAVFAYEPIWAIGAEEPAPRDHVVQVCKGLRGVVDGYGKREFRVLYGGSAGPGSWEELRKGVDGLFLGRFAHKVERFGEVVGEVERSIKSPSGDI